MGKRYATEQPKHGDTILHCGHPGADKQHFMKPGAGVLRFRRPDGTVGETEWLVACAACYDAAGPDKSRIQYRGDGRWLGFEPTITVPEKPAAG